MSTKRKLTRAEKREIEAAIARAKKSDKPTLIACHSVIGYGAAKEGTSKVHGSPIGAEDLLAARKRLGFEYAPFEVPQDILNEWRSFGKKGQADREAWEKRFAGMDAAKKAEFERTVIRHALPAGWKEIAIYPPTRCLPILRNTTARLKRRAR